jgi:ligand-binding sensor domain-containing protein/serine phosphatase RsbU (regulator of sigma subunit)
MNKVRVLSVLFSLLITRILFSQQFLKPEVLSLDRGLLNSCITSLTTDSKGFIWAGTENGLYRYDGYHFIWVGQTPGKTGLTGSMQIIRIEKDKNNDNLWLLTGKGLELYKRKTGIITVYTSQLMHPENIPAKSFVDLYAAEGPTIWLITEARLFKMIPGSVITSFSLPLEKNAVPTCITGDNHGNLWIGTNDGILVFDIHTEKFAELFSGKKDNFTLLTHGSITCMYTDSRENLWIGTRSGMNLFDPMNIDFEKIYPDPYKKNDPLNEIRSIQEDENSNLVLVTGEGIIFYNYRTEKFKVPEIQWPDPSFNTQLSAILIDRQGIIWAGSRKGLLKIRKAPIEIENITTDQKNRLKIRSNFITAIATDPDQMLWLGYRDAGITVTNSSGSREVSYRAGDYSRLSGNDIHSFYTDRQGDFYVVSAHAIDQFNFASRRFEPVLASFPQTDREVFNDLELYALAKDSLNNFWIGTNDGLVYADFINRKCKTIHSLILGQDSIGLSLIYDLITDPSYTLWLGTDDGLISYHPTRKQLNRFTPYDKDLLNTGHKNVYCMEEGPKGTFWIGTSEGCYLFDIQKRTFSAVSAGSGLIGSEVMSVTTDPFHNLWMATSLGIFYYCPSLQSLRHFDFGDGLDNFGFSLNASVAGKDGKAYFGGKNGLTVIRNDSVFATALAPPTVITGITLLHKGKIFRQYIERPDTIRIPRGNYAVKVEFTLPDLNRTERNQFRYTLSPTGKKAEWNDLYTSNNVILGGLNQGSYLFSVLGSTGNGEWNSKPDDLHITVEVSFWRSKTAFSVYFFLTLALIFFLFRYWTRQLLRANKAYREREKIAKQIMLQKEELTLKNKSITDSINYARRIQNAMLPPMKLLKSYFPYSFLLYLPKDIVSGDFYWINKLYNKIFISAVDCTGHGVPGAFMSIIGFELFRKITNIEGLTRPSDILNKLNEDFHEIFRDVENIILRDGMDVAFCAIDINDMILEYSGAFNPLYLIRDNKITEIKGDRFAIGLDETNFKDLTFKNHMIPLQEGDLIYIFSDGYADQFGGPEGKKFKYRRFRHLLLNIHQLPMEDQRDILETSLRDWKGENEQVDDVMVIGIKIDH